VVPAHSTHSADRNNPLSVWWQTSLGASLVSAEAELLAEALEDVFGWEMLQIGAWGPGRHLLTGSRVRRQTVLAQSAFGCGADVLGRPSQLPVTSDSVDAVLLPHTLEFEPDPYAIVREADRVLVAEGKLLVMGFRPWSAWGLRARASRDGFPPGMRRVLPERRLRDWLGVLGYEVVSDQRYLYCSPWSSGPKTGDGNGPLLRRGIVNPFPASAYLLKARKRVYTLTPIRPRFRREPAVIGGLVKPTTRTTRQQW